MNKTKFLLGNMILGLTALWGNLAFQRMGQGAARFYANYAPETFIILHLLLITLSLFYFILVPMFSFDEE